MKYLKWGLCLFALLVAFAGSASAQTAATASVTGTVTDQSGAVVPGAEVELLDTATNSTRKVTADENGVYRFINVVPATYRVTATAQGFKKAVIQSMRIEVAKSYNQSFQLEVGDVASTVEVMAATSAEIQTMDATVGNAVGGIELQRLPTSNRSAASLLLLQPLVTPGRGQGIDTGGQVAGARSDQTTFLLDGGDSTSNTEGSGGYNSGFDGTPLPMIPVPVESIEEFRVGTTNPNATFGRSQGGQVALVTKRGTNDIHGSAYWYHQNDNLNANSWDRNFAGLPKAELKDNRYGFTLGGPVMKDRLFLFGHYEGRNFPRTANVTRTVPLPSLKSGILQFQDSTGSVVSYNLLTSTLCGPAQNSPCDPRNIGISPVIQSIYNLLPAPNQASGGDGLNTRNFLATIDNTLKEQFAVARLDYKISNAWDFFGSFRYAHTDTSGTQQIDISGITGCTAPCSTRVNPLEPRYFVVGVNGQISPKLLTETRFSWYRHWWEWGTTPPFPQVAGTAAAIQLAGEGANKTIADPMNIDTQNARSRVWNGKDSYIAENLSWLAGKHTVQFGGNFRNENIFHQRTDQVTGGLSGGPIFWARARSGGGGSFLQIPDTNRPPRCGGAITTNCLTSLAEEQRWNTLYAATLGLIDQSGQMLARDGSFNPLPFGTGLEAQVNIKAYEAYFQDVWRMTPDFTLTYGVTYQVQRPPVEELDRQTITVYAATGEPVYLDSYYAQRDRAARSGQIFNPDIAFSPIGAINDQKYVTPIDWNNVGPRISAAWQPNWDNWLFGNKKTAIRGGWGVTYTRMNGVGLVMTPILGVGLGEIVRCIGPSTTGACLGATTPTNGFRVGPDGDGTNILPSAQPLNPAQIPFQVSGGLSNPTPFGASRNFAIDPGMELGYSHSFDFTWQRELPGDMLLEIGYVGRAARNLTQNTDLNASHFQQVDSISGQTLAQAHDAVAQAIRAGGAVGAQPWFENYLGDPAVTQLLAVDLGLAAGTPNAFTTCASLGAGGCTGAMAAFFPFEFSIGDLASVMLFGVDSYRLAGGLQPLDNLQALLNNFTSDGGWSDYHAMFFTVRKRTSHGLAWDFNYTLGKSTDVFGLNQENTAFSWTSPFFRELDEQPSLFDVRHVFNAHWYYELPFGRGKRFSTESGVLDKFIGGWFMSGIFTGSSGLPRCNFAGGNYGSFTAGSCAIGTANVGSNSVHTTSGSGGIGTNNDRNLFSDPEAVFNSFRYPLMTQDTRLGFGDVRGLPRWNVDLSVGKKLTFYERYSVVFNFDMLNVFNHMEFQDPALDISGITASQSAFGVLDSQFAGPRRIQFGLRVEF
ncbi:MAG: carboxypeptidase regulatory-like domain-containing protein [Acidobacteria bacterium]|nr:carboxypeptidase regulatory-like domain-containing protein [Acidobacteriota bacterium]